MNIDMVVDLQFGSTGKGLLAGYLAKRNKYDTIMTAWAPNAGHTFISEYGTKYVVRALPNGMVSSTVKQILLGPGSVIDPAILAEELERYEQTIEGVRIIIHPHAAVVMPIHRQLESSMVKIGSTMKGVGAAMIERIKREPGFANTALIHLRNTPLEQYLVTQREYDEAVMRAENVLVEGAQGYSLSMYHGFYPYTTSRDVTPYQMLADVGAPFDTVVQVFGTARTYPIRVANRFDNDGVMVGWSGPSYPDQYEMKWAEIGVRPELTTVTQLPRRLFTYSSQQIREASWRCGVDSLFLNFVNYASDPSKARMIIEQVEEDAGAPVRWLGLGPTENDIIDRFNVHRTEVEVRIDEAIAKQRAANKEHA